MVAFLFTIRQLKNNYMAFYHYSISNNKISRSNGIVSEVAEDYVHYEDKSFGESTLNYKIEDGKITDIISESTLTEAYASNEVQEFLDNLS